MTKLKKDNKGWAQWSYRHRIKYFLFIIIHYKALMRPKNTKNKQGVSKFFKKMERWLCR